MSCAIYVTDHYRLNGGAFELQSLYIYDCHQDNSTLQVIVASCVCPPVPNVVK